MKKLFPLILAFALVTTAKASPITGEVALAGLDTFNSSGIHFLNPGVILTGSGDLSLLTSFPDIDLTSFHYASAGGITLFDWTHSGTNVTFDITALTLVQVLPNFLNAKGTAEMTFTGRTPTEFDFALTSTHSDDVASYTMNIVPAAAVSEPTTLSLLGLGVMSIGMLRFRKRRA